MKNNTKAQFVDGVSVTGKEGLYTYVDLGLPSGTKWATYNVGATKPTEYGDYFAWGETKPKENYSWETYKWWKDTGEKNKYDSPIYEYTKYCTDSKFGTVDNKTVLDAEDDAATANWGSAWRMPTLYEIKELFDGCSWEWVNDFNGSGVTGLRGTSKANRATIFLPAAGYRDNTDLDFAGYYVGDYWSSSLFESNSSGAYYLYFYVLNVGRSGYDSRYYGLSVRAVLR